VTSNKVRVSPRYQSLFKVKGTEDNLDQCDSLAKEVISYTEANHRKDSVYESQLLQFDSLLHVKDRLVETSQNAYNDLRILFDKSLTSQTILQKENLALTKQNKRQKFKSKVLTGASLILSGLTTSYLLRH
jgi:hypothetical protein